MVYTVVRKRDGKVVNSVGCSVYLDLKEIGITYFIGNAYRRKEFAAEAVRAYMLDCLNKYVDMPRLIAIIRTENMAFCKTVMKAGYMLQEARMYKDINNIKDIKKQEYTVYSFE